MTHLRMTAHYDAPIEKVFELAIDYRRYPEWNVAYDVVDEVKGPPDVVGSKIHAVMVLMGRKMEGWAEIVEVDKPRILKFTGTGTQGGSVTSLYRFTPVGTTGTDAEFETDYELPAGFLNQFADKLFIQRSVERNIRHSMENFKALVEAQVPVLV